MKKRWEDCPTFQMMVDVVRSRIKSSMELFNVMTTQTAFPLRIKKAFEEEFGEELPNRLTILGVKIYWQEN